MSKYATLFLMLLWTTVFSPAAAAQPCPVLEMEGPKTAQARDVVTYRLLIYQHPDPESKITWTIKGGTITEGQGTMELKVKPVGEKMVAYAVVNSRRCNLRFSSKTKIINFLPNMPPTVTAFAEVSEITLACPDDGRECEPTINPVVPLRAQVSDPDGDVPLYRWSATPGRIVGEGPEQYWDLSAVPPGAYVATIEVDDGNGGVSTSSVSVTVRACNTCSRPDPTAIIGEVRDSAGRAVANAQVKAIRTGGGSGHALTGPDGRYTIRYIKTGPYSVTASESCCHNGSQKTNLERAGDQVLVNFKLTKKQ